MRRFGSPPTRGLSYVHRPGAYAVLQRGRRLLVTRQLRPRDELQLPGGGIDPGESPMHALHREVFEETGWHIAQIRRLGTFRRYVYMPEYGIHAEKVCHLFRARPVRQIADPTEPDHRAVWVDARDAAPRLSNAGDAWFLRRVLNLSDRIQ